MRRTAGFTLIELVLVMVIISVGLLGIARLFGNTSTSLSTNEIVQQAAQYAQECAEGAIARRRDSGFAWFASNTFSCGGNPGNFTRTANPVGSIYTGIAVGACNGNDPCPCPTGVSCRNVSITVTSTVNGSLSSFVTLVLVDY